MANAAVSQVAVAYRRPWRSVRSASA